MVTKGISKYRREYETRVNRVIDYIKFHTVEDLSLTMLARVANFSPYHFHRVFKAIVGETLKDFTNRIRMEKAGRMLISSPRDAVTRIALECGFSSSAVFSRSFRKYFGVSPTEWRSGEWKHFSKNYQPESKKSKRKSKQRQDSSLSERDTKSRGKRSSKAKRGRKYSDIKVSELPAYHVAYVRHIGPYDPELYDFFQRFAKWARARDLLKPNDIILGIPHNSPRFTDPEKCHYDACIMVPETFQPEGEVNVMDIPGVKYALCQFKGTAEEHEKKFEEIFLNWMPENGYQPDDRDFFHRYRGLDYYNPETGILECEICVPVKPL